MTDILVDLYAEEGHDFTSNSIEAVAYDRDSKTLYVEFQSGPTLYAYNDVEESTYNLFVAADSLNHFWRDHLSGDAERFAGSLVLREDDPIQPETKWLTNPSGDTPVLTEDEADTAALNLGVLNGTIAVPGFNWPVVQPTRYGVEYTMTATTEDGEPVAPSGPFKPMFQALSEADALAQFEAAKRHMETITGWTLETKVKAVTHYFD